MSKKSLPRLIIASSEEDADMLYATGFFAPDPFIFLEQNGRSTVVLSDLEIDRGRSQARADEVVALSDISKLCRQGKDSAFAEHAVAFLHTRKVRRAAVPGSFPLGLATSLEKPASASSQSPGCFGRSASSRRTPS